jgi:signal transduction histidine kinase/ActR/RegA family two-component response regulator
VCVQHEPPPEHQQLSSGSTPPELRSAGESILAAGSVLDLLDMPLVLVDADLRVRSANRAFADVLGIEPPMPGGQRFTDLLEPSSRDWLERCLQHDGTSRRAGLFGRVHLAGNPDTAWLASLVPFRMEGRLLGYVVSLREGSLEMFADPSLNALLEREKTEKEKLEALLTVSQAVTSSLEPEVVLDTIAREVRRVVQVDEVTVFLFDEEQQVLKPVACDVIEYRDEVMALRLNPGQGITGTIFLTGVGEIVQDSESDPRALTIPNTPPEESSLLCVPLVVRQRVQGVITLSRIGPARRAFVPGDLELVTLFAAECSAAIQNAQIYRQLKSAFDELRRTQTQLVQSAKLNALGEMAGGVAHDFNNILAAILGRTQLLLRTPLDAETRRQLDVIEQAALDGAHTVRRVQEFTRVRMDEHFQPIDLNAVIESVVEFTRPAWMTNAKKRGVSVHVHQQLAAVHHVEGNASELREVFTNLVLNALDAMPWGGHLYVATENAGDRVIARFRDTGVGMDEHTRSRVFDPFFTTKAVQGTGLGLSVAYGIVARHRGTIDVESERGVGTEFVVTLPAAQSVPVTREAPIPAGPLPSRAILAIDDEEPVLDVLADMLRTLGQDVTVAVGGEAGLVAVERLHPLIVFTDLGMPDVNGWEVAQHVRAHRSDAALVMVTGWGFQLEEDAAQERGVDLILTKPFTLEDVEHALARVTELLERRRAA